MVPSPQAEKLKPKALDELHRRLGSNEAILGIVQERLALRTPIGTLPDWKPGAQEQR